MSWFTKQPEMEECVECGVYFAPHDDPLEGFREYCRVHRKPHLDKLRRMRQVIRWAENNWEKLVSQMEEDLKEERRQAQEDLSRMANAMQGQRNVWTSPLGRVY